MASFFAAPIFDHAKVAIIDEMTRLGVPPGNPFFGEASQFTRLAYYYLWHFSAAELALATGASGWEADIASTWIAAFSSLALMMGLATWLSGRASAALWVLLLAATASARTVVSAAFGFESVSSVLHAPTGFAGWLFQAAWVPQHIASASCVVLAILLIGRLMQQPSGLLIVTLALVVAAGFESSTWIGGVTFLLAASSVSVVLLVPAKTDQRLSFLLNASAAAVLAAFLTAPFVYDQIIATAMRDGGPPIAVMHYRVLGPAFPEGVGRVLDLPAYWLVLLVVEFPAIYVTGLIALTSALTSRALDCERQRVATTFAVLAGVSLAVGWLLVSTLADNNDLGWRAILPAAMVLIIFAAIGLSGWIAARAHVAAVAAVCALAAGGHRRRRSGLRQCGRPPERVREDVRGDAGHVGCRAPAFGPRRAHHEQSPVFAGHDAMARQHFMGAACGPPLVLRGQGANSALYAAAARAARGDQRPVHSRFPGGRDTG